MSPYTKSCLRIFLKLLALLPVIIFHRTGKGRYKDDINRWKEMKKTPFNSDYLATLDLLATYKEFRNLYYLRFPLMEYVCFFLRPLSSLYLNTADIGGGLFIQHGFSTVIAANIIGRNCWINQMVCVGHTAAGNPTIGDNVRIGVGAIVIGKIEIGNNVTIGAGAIVNKDLPSGSLAVPQNARIIENHIVKIQ